MKWLSGLRVAHPDGPFRFGFGPDYHVPLRESLEEILHLMEAGRVIPTEVRWEGIQITGGLVNEMTYTFSKFIHGISPGMLIQHVIHETVQDIDDFPMWNVTIRWSELKFDAVVVDHIFYLSCSPFRVPDVAAAVA